MWAISRKNIFMPHGPFLKLFPSSHMEEFLQEQNFWIVFHLLDTFLENRASSLGLLLLPLTKWMIKVGLRGKLEEMQ